MLNRDRVYYLSLEPYPVDEKILGMIRFDLSIADIEEFEALNLETKVWETKQSKFPHPIHPEQMIMMNIYKGPPGSHYVNGPGWVSSTVTDKYLFANSDTPPGWNIANWIESQGHAVAKDWYKYVALYEIILNKSIPVLREMEESEEII